MTKSSILEVVELKRVWGGESQKSSSKRMELLSIFNKVVEGLSFFLQIGWNRGNNSRPYACGHRNESFYFPPLFAV